MLKTTTMNHMTVSRLLPFRICTSSRHSLTAHTLSYRALSTTSARHAGPAGSLSSLATTMSREREGTPSSTSTSTSTFKTSNPLGQVDQDLALLFGTNHFGRQQSEPHETEAARNLKQTYYLHVYSHKHNTHITLCTPTHEPVKKLSLSTGNIGFKKSNRGTYDAAYQLTSFFLSQIVEQGHLPQLKRIEIVLRGFGVGREAFVKAMLGQEGARFRSRIVAVTDATRLKFGGTRSKAPRRLG